MSQLAILLLGSPETSNLPDDVALVVAELVANSVRARAIYLQVGVELGVFGDFAGLQLSVTDDAAGMPYLLDPQPHDSHGRGLRMVDHIAVAWGVRALGGRKQVWALLAVE